MKQQATTAQAVGLMERMGGSFVQAIAHAWRVADGSNQERLQRAFPEYFERYPPDVLERNLAGATHAQLAEIERNVRQLQRQLATKCHRRMNTPQIGRLKFPQFEG